MKMPVIVLLGALILVFSPPQGVHANEPYPLNEYAITLMERGEHAKALEQLQKAFSMNPYDPVLKKNLAEAYTFVGQRQLRENDCEAAAASFDQARELEPETARYYLFRGIALYYCKYSDAARNELERARGLGGDSADILYYLARIEYDGGNLAVALEFLDKALLGTPDFAPVKELADKVRRELAVEKSKDRSYSSKFVIDYDAAQPSQLAGDILDALEEAYNSVGGDFSFFPQGRIPVILYTRKDFRLATPGPDWSGGLYDGKIRLPLGGVESLTPQLKSVLYHEYTHVVVQEIAHGKCPTWLNEGLAELEGRRQFNHPLLELAKPGAYLPFANLEGAFTSLDAKDVGLAYQQSYALVGFMVNAYGWPKITELLQRFGSGATVADAFRKTLADFGLDYDGVIAEWRSYMKREGYGARE